MLKSHKKNIEYIGYKNYHIRKVYEQKSQHSNNVCDQPSLLKLPFTALSMDLINMQDVFVRLVPVSSLSPRYTTLNPICEGEGSKILFQSPKSFQAEHF